MKVLGLNATGPNTASCLVVGGEPVAFAEEERFTRVKLAMNQIPTRSSRYCLEAAGLDVQDLDAITLGWGYNKYPTEMARFYAKNMSHPAKDEFSRLYEDISLKEKSPGVFQKRLEIAYRRAGFQGQLPPITYYPHHLCHAYSVFYPSPFERATIIVIDGSGEEMATSVWLGSDRDVVFQYSHDLPDSLGYYYAALTEYLGFSVFTGEGKVMGLAPYGKPNLDLRAKLERVLTLVEDGYRVDPEYIYFATRTNSLRHTDKLAALLCEPPRQPESPLTEWHAELAWEVQHKLEQAMEQVVLRAIARTGVRDVAIAGGVAMNCKMNGFISRMPAVDRCFVIPASNDSGASLGSALAHCAGDRQVREKAQKLTAYSGPSFDSEHVVERLREFKINSYRRYPSSKLLTYVAARLAEGAIVGWFQGRMEVGARSLGNRSILANPADPEMKDRINREVKHREPFRPFAPAILLEHAKDYFSIPERQPYEPYHNWMLQAAAALPGVRERIPAVVHVDGSIRPQVVSERSNSIFYALLRTFHARTGIPVLLNTSFNVRGEPIVCTPDDAIRCFFSTGLDLIVMEDVVVEKAR